MNSYAILKSGVVINMLLSGKSPAEVAASWPDYDVVPESAVPQAALENYRYWRERP